MRRELLDIDGVGAAFKEEEEDGSARFIVERHPTAVMSNVVSQLRQRDDVIRVRTKNTVEIELVAKT